MNEQLTNLKKQLDEVSSQYRSDLHDYIVYTVSSSCPSENGAPNKNIHTCIYWFFIWFHSHTLKLIYILYGLDQCLHEKNEMELKLLNSSALLNQHASTDDQKLIKLLQEELRNYVSISQI